MVENQDNLKDDVMKIAKAMMGMKSQEAHEMFSEKTDIASIFGQLALKNYDEIASNPEWMNQLIIANIDASIEQLTFVRDVLREKLGINKTNK